MNLQFNLPGYRVNYPRGPYILGIEAFFLMGQGKSSQPVKQRTNNLPKTVSEKQLRILIVDDEKRFREAMTFHLTELFDAKVKVVDSGQAAINHLRGKNSYEVIFLDIKMPGMDGIETYRRLRKMKVVCPIIMMSAYADSEKWEEAKQLGAELIPKPFPENELAEILKNISR